MNIHVASTNKAKVRAVEEAVKDYDIFKEAIVKSVDVSSGVSDQPKSLDETVQGAQSRAQNAFGGCDYSFGIESGLMAVPETKTGFMDVCVCAVYDGHEYHMGLSSAFELPLKITDMMLRQNLDMSQAINAAGLTNNPSIGAAEGAIGILTKGRLTRLGYTKQAITTALIHLENAELYGA
jgi:inosine/xanthosine triphosphatase